MLSNHVTLVNDNIGAFPPEAKPQLDKLARLAGARFVLRALAHLRSAPHGARLDLRMKWANVGPVLFRVNAGRGTNARIMSHPDRFGSERHPGLHQATRPAIRKKRRQSSSLSYRLD